MLGNTDQCQIDAGFMKELGVNTVRVETVEPRADHDGCMQAFASQGMYVWVDIPTPTISFDRTEPAWTMDMFDHFSSVVDAFAPYDNLLAMAIANEVILDEDSTAAAPFIKAATRDIKAYRDVRGYRKIPIAYSSADVPSQQATIADYLTCGEETDTIDVFGMNTFSWCGNSSYQEAGYDTTYQELQHLNIPSVFTETGCNAVSPWTWEEVSVMLGAVLPSVFSGVLVYEWVQGVNEYGLVEYDNDDGIGFPTMLEDYDNLKSVFSIVSPPSTASTAYRPSNSVPSCPTTNSDWTIDATATLPTIAKLQLQTVSALTTISSSEVVAAGPTEASPAADDSAATKLAEAEATGLSTGAIAGIAIGGAAVAMSFGIGAFLLLRKRRAQWAARNGQVLSGTDGGQYDGKAELSGMSTGLASTKPELDGEPQGSFPSRITHEMDAAGRHRQLHPYEKDAMGSDRWFQTYEMEGSRPPVVEMDGSQSSQYRTGSEQRSGHR